MKDIELVQDNNDSFTQFTNNCELRTTDKEITGIETLDRDWFCSNMRCSCEKKLPLRLWSFRNLLDTKLLSKLTRSFPAIVSKNNLNGVTSGDVKSRYICFAMFLDLGAKCLGRGTIGVRHRGTQQIPVKLFKIQSGIKSLQTYPMWHQTLANVSNVASNPYKHTHNGIKFMQTYPKWHQISAKGPKEAENPCQILPESLRLWNDNKKLDFHVSTSKLEPFWNLSKSRSLP